MKTYDQYCSVAKALDVIGDRWNLLIVRELLLQGPCRFTDLQHGLPGIATNLLSSRLRDLDDAGVIRREHAPPPVATTLISLTDTGRELKGVLHELGKWGVRYMGPKAAGSEGPGRFCSHWLAFPVSLFFDDQDPSSPPVSIEVRTGDRPVHIERIGGKVATVLGPATSPELVVEGPPQEVLGVLGGYFSVEDAAGAGVTMAGDPSALTRLRSRPVPTQA